MGVPEGLLGMPERHLPHGARTREILGHKRGALGLTAGEIECIKWAHGCRALFSHTWSCTSVEIRVVTSGQKFNLEVGAQT